VAGDPPHRCCGRRGGRQQHAQVQAHEADGGRPSRRRRRHGVQTATKRARRPQRCDALAPIVRGHARAGRWRVRAAAEPPPPALPLLACLQVLSGHTARVTCVAVWEGGGGGGDSPTAISGSADATLRVWDLGSGCTRHVLVRRPLPSWNRSILTEICLCHACSCQEILSRPEDTAHRAQASCGHHTPAACTAPRTTHWLCAVDGDRRDTRAW
jgi:hypothetical protein